MVSNAPPITLYTTQSCPYCRSAERLLDRLKIPYQERDLTSNPAERIRIVEETGWRTVPVVMIGGELIGGFRELEILHTQGKLMEKLKQAGWSG